MSERYGVIAARIRQELSDLELVVRRAERASAATRSSETDQDLFVDSAALNLHDFYTGLERLFQHIATSIDGSMSEGREWHRDLLNQMSLELPQVRPQVLSAGAVGSLKDYLGFRHIVRHLYAIELEPERVNSLVSRLSTVFAQVRSELDEFTKFLEQLEAT
jgi:hypothetical protein